MIVVEYLHWHFLAGPRWLLGFYWNLERALLQFFSVPTMLKTLFSHWRRDRVSLKTSALGTLLEAFIWNGISRFIGFIVRSVVLVAWLLVQLLGVLLGAALLVLFFTWPLIAVALIIAGLKGGL